MSKQHKHDLVFAYAITVEGKREEVYLCSDRECKFEKRTTGEKPKTNSNTFAFRQTGY